ncbi:MAG: signal recognition particle protein [Acutalibacteraceae bacterium]|mgnify:CR=1 FL=1|nr:signal recognition particle protein [Clostridia bacterium]MBQ2319134.1 signal recognition particle protein [Clostridia bacterium]MEE1126846.1 signal recognition particle protein [Acutalibacteraceae bacterium]
MAFDNLTDKLSAAFKRLKSKGKLSETDVKEAMREIRLALLEADVNYKVAKDFTNSLTEKCIGEKVMESLTPAQMVIKLVNEELTQLMGGENVRLNTSSKLPSVIMMCGLQGSGKTTHSAKLAKKLKSAGHRPLLVACDIYRPAAIDQLKVVGEQVGVPVFDRGTQKPEKTADEAIRYARDYGNDYVILDTAGRLHIDEDLMAELTRIKDITNPCEIILVVDSMVGQDAVNVAKAFNDLLEIDSVLLTKLDGDTRGGAALSIRAVTGKPIKYIGTGEKLDDIEEFHPSRMASRILGMGDVLSLIEKAEQQIDEKQAAEMAAKLKNNTFDMNDLLAQFQEIKKMGPLKQVMSMLPGMGNKLKDVDIDDRQLLRVESIIYSMTKRERERPDIINPSRKRRIAAGSGTSVEEVNRLLRQHEQMKKMFKQLNAKGKGKRGRGMQLPPGFKF